VRSRGRPAKLLASMSSPVSTKLPLVGHTNFSTAIATFTQSIAIKPLACSPKGGDGKISCETMPHRAALRLSRSALKFALPLSHPCSKRGFSRRFYSWPSTDGFMALIEDFRLESSSPEQKFVSQRPADADCLNLGSHKPRLTPAHDEKIARSTENKMLDGVTRSQLSRTYLLPLGTNTRAALPPHCSHHVEHVAVTIDVSARQPLPDVPRPHNDGVTGQRGKFCSGRSMYDRSVFDLELGSVYWRVHVPLLLQQSCSDLVAHW
jgi:hypothetical protein